MMPLTNSSRASPMTEIMANNTVFIVTADEGDHFAGGPPTNPGCDGVSGPCTHAPGAVGPNTIGEVLSNIQSLLGKEDPTLNFTNTPFDMHFDVASRLWQQRAKTIY